MPEWLMQKEEYIPPKDKDTFLNKSILTLLKILSKFSQNTEMKNRRININTTLQILSVILVLILVSLSRSLLFVGLIGVTLFFLISLLPLNNIKRIMFTSVTALLFSLMVFLPSIIMGNLHNSLLILIKVFCSIMGVSTLTSINSWNQITASLKDLFIPDIFIFILDITVKYIILLGEFALNMLYSLKVRSIGKNNKKHNALSGIMGTMFIKSKEMSEEMYDAMECRGFCGEYIKIKKVQIGVWDYIFIAINVIIIMVYIYTV